MRTSLSALVLFASAFCSTGESPFSAEGNQLLELIKKGDERGAMNLIKRMPSARYVVAGGETPLTYAAWFGRESLIEPLLSKGARPDHQTDGGNTALSYAVARKNFAVLMKLAQAGANVNTPDVKGYTPLMKAAGLGYEQGTAYLRALGARADIRDKDGLTVINHLIRGGHFELLPLFRRAKVLVNNKDALGDAPLVYAVQAKCGACISFLLHRGAPVNERNVFGETPLMYAVHLNRSDLVRQLLQAGASPRIRDAHDNYDAFILARHNPRILRLLKRHDRPRR